MTRRQTFGHAAVLHARTLQADHWLSACRGRVHLAWPARRSALAIALHRADPLRTAPTTSRLGDRAGVDATAVRECVHGTIKWTVEKIDPIRDWINLILTAWPEPS